MTKKEPRKFRRLTLAVSVGVFVFFAAITYAVQLTLRPAAAPLATARNAMERVSDFSLLDHEGKQHQLYRYADSRAVVLFVYGVDCNIARDSIPALKQLRERFAEQDDGFLMKLDGFLMKLRERFATRTWQVVYRGPVDDRLYYEFTKEGAQQHFLRDAIEALLDGRAVGLAAPSAIGCRVSLHNKKDVSYAKQVVPILTEKCVSCHQAGGIAPW